MSVSRTCVCAVVSIVMTLGLAAPSSAVVDGVSAPAYDRRLDAVALFERIAPGGGCGGWVSGTCTLVGPNVVLIARHCLDISTSDPLPPISLRQYRVRFRRALNGLSENKMLPNGDMCNGVYQEIDVVQLVDAQNPSCDQVLAYLASAPVGIQPIMPALNNPPIHATPAILAGWGYSGECFASGTPWELRIAHGQLPENWSGNDYLSFSLCTLSTIEPCLVCPSTGGPYVNANLHDSGAPVLIEVPSTDPRDPTPELRLIGTVSSTNTAHRPSAWNNAGGLPQLVETTPEPHLLPGDFDGNGVVNVADIIQYINAFFSGRMDGDTNENGLVEVADILLFVDDWFR